jgi:hypothetical protein
MLIGLRVYFNLILLVEQRNLPPHGVLPQSAVKKEVLCHIRPHLFLENLSLTIDA